MRYLLLLIFSFTLMFSCGTESKPMPAKAKTAAKGKKVKTASANSQTPYLKHIKKNVGLNNAQIKQINRINKKYSPRIKALKKKNKWKGNPKKALLAKKNTELKVVIGKSWSKWEAANIKWAKAN